MFNKTFIVTSILLCLSIIIICYESAAAQTLHPGLKLEFYHYSQRIGESSDNHISPLPSIHIILKNDFSDKFSIELRPGILFRPEFFDGFELAIAANYFAWNKYFITSGMNMHFVSSEAHGTGIVEVTDSKIIYFFLAGFGYQLNKRFSVDVSLHHAINGNYGYSYSGYSAIDLTSGSHKIINMLKLGLTASF